MEHRLKTLPPYFAASKDGTKKFELRKNDRNYQVGDTLVLEEYIDDIFNGGYTGQVMRKRVTYMLENCPEFGLSDGYCILGTD